jgi:large subunit ribosomal protein L15
MSLTELKSKVGKKARKRVGRGNGSKMGTYSTRGMKGQSARSGGRRRPGFEGGQTPYFMKMPKLKGFKNPNRVEFQVVNIGDLNQFEDGSEITIENLLVKNLISKKDRPVKLLAGKGELEKKVTIVVHKASKAAIAAVEAKKGSVQLLTQPEAAKPETEEQAA